MGLPTLNVCPLKLSSYNCPLLVVNWGAWALKPGGRDLELVLSSMESPPLAIEVLKCALQADKTIGCTYFYCNRSIFFDNSARVLLWQKKKCITLGKEWLTSAKDSGVWALLLWSHTSSCQHYSKALAKGLPASNLEKRHHSERHTQQNKALMYLRQTCR